MKNTLGRLLQSPEIAYLCLGLCGGSLILILTPPFQVADEYGHFVRAYQISEGSISGIREGKTSGAILPASLSAMADLLSPGLSTYEPDKGIPNHRERKFDPELLKKAWQIPLNPSERRFSIFSNTILYWPTTYFPEALAIFLGRQFYLPPLGLFYLARVAHLLLSFALGYYTIKIMPTGKWLLLLLMLTPMAMYQGSSASGDAVLNSLSFLYIASVLKFALQPDQMLNLRNGLALAALACLVALAKQAYFLMPLLLLLIPAGSFGGKNNKIATLLLILLISWGGILAWSLHIQPIATPQFEGADPVRQTSFILAHPLLFLKIILNPGIPFTSMSLVEQFIGWLGWLDAQFPVWFYCAAYAVLFLVAYCDANVPLTLMQRIAFLAIAYASYLMIASLIYLTGMPVGAPNLIGIQGRYLIPFAPLLFLAFQTSKPDASYRRVSGIAIIWQVFAIFCTVRLILERYYWK